MEKRHVVAFFFVIISILIISLFIIVKNNNNDNNKNKEDNNKNYLKGKHYVEIDVEKYGKIELELDADIAPITVTNFINLVNNGFYDGLTFHRIISGFMIQGGGYDKKGNKMDAKSIKGEFLDNHVKNNISHKRGVISMARIPSDNNSASSEFFIMQEDALYLDGSYAAFGYVTKGMEVVDKIAEKAKPIDNNGSIDIENRPIIKSIKVIEK